MSCIFQRFGVEELNTTLKEIMRTGDHASCLKDKVTNQEVEKFAPDLKDIMRKEPGAAEISSLKMETDNYI